MSLRDQLLKAGLVTEKQVKQLTQQQAKKSPSRHKPPEVTPQQRAVQQAQAEKSARDQALNLKKQQKAERKARAAEVNQLVEQYRVPKIESDDYFNFVHRNTVERIAVDAATRQRIGSGELLIVRYRGQSIKCTRPGWPAICAAMRVRSSPAVDLRSIPRKPHWNPRSSK